MESKINYTLVGSFVVLLLAGLIGFAYWLGKYSSEKEFDYYHVYMTESVAGLSADASVKFLGVEVGTVGKIGLNPKQPEQVELLLKIKHNTLIKTDTTATLKSFGLTGLTYVELEGGSKDSLTLTASKNDIPIIPASPSIYMQAYESIGGISENAVLALDKFNRLLSDENLQNITIILAETNALAKDTREQLQGIKVLVEQGIIMEKSLTDASGKVGVASVSIMKMAENLDKVTTHVSQSISNDVKQSLQSFNQLLYQLDSLTKDVQRTTKAIENSPSDLLFKSVQPRPGPGEEGYNEN